MQSAIAVCLCGLPAMAQAQANPQAASDTQAKPPIIEIPKLFKPGGFDTRYAVPDLAPDRLLLPRLNTRVLTVRPGVELVVDWTGFRQDDASLAQVGVQRNLLEVRSVSFELLGEIGLKKRIGYKVGVEYNGFDVNPESKFAVTDAAVNLALPRWRAIVYAGQMREDFGYEVVGSIATMPQSERVIAPFSSPINPGVKVIHVLGRDDRMTLAYGLYKNDWGEGEGDLAFAGRATRLMIDDPGHRRFLHVGAALRLSGANAAARYSGRPGVNAADVFVDTGDFEAKSARHIGLEAHYSDGPWSVLGEYVSAKVDAPASGNPRFHGFYVMGSWVMTGESRPYDRSRGTVKRIIPNGRWGALELVGRYAIVDLDDGAITGGRYSRVEVGTNWWATTRWKLGLLFGHVRLNRFGTTGTTDSLLLRWQWVY